MSFTRPGKFRVFSLIINLSCLHNKENLEKISAFLFLFMYTLEKNLAPIITPKKSGATETN